MLTSKALQGACRALTQALCTRIYVEDGVVTDDVLADPFEELLYLRRRDMARQRTSGRPRNAYGAPKGAIGRRPGADLFERAFLGCSSNEAALVEVPGIEPGSNGDDQGLLRA